MGTSNRSNVDPIGTTQSVQNSMKAAQQTAADLLEIERLRSTNELYANFRSKWDFYMSAYEGGDLFATPDNIARHPREHVDDFEERCKRIHYINYCEPLVDFFTAFIFAETIQRNGGTNRDWYNEFIKNVNNKGEDVTTFMQQVSDDKQIYGMVYVLVDAPPLPTDRKLSKLEEQKLGLRPYWVLIRPDEILDWVTDSFDKYSYVKRRQEITDISNGVHRLLERYTEWEGLNIKVTDIDVTNPNKPILLSPVITDNQVGEIPIVLFRYKRHKKYRFMGSSFLTDLSYNNREVMNLTSLLQEFLYRQAFNILAVQMDGTLPTYNQMEGEQGSANLMQYPKEANAPSYIAPSSEPAKFIAEERQFVVNEMYKRAAQDTVNELFNGVKSSGFSKQQGFSTTVPKIATRAETLEKGENRLMELTLMYMSKKWDGKIKYKDRYELTNISDALQQMTLLFKDLQMPSETFVKEELIRMVHEFDGKIPIEIMNTITAEINAMDFAEWQDAQKLALIGKAAISPEVGTAFGKAGSTASKGVTPASKTGRAKRKPTTAQEAKAESSKQPVSGKK
jgi:hypothetical protein